MPNKHKKIRKNTKHYFVLQGREDLYWKDEVAVAFKPYIKSKNRVHTSITPTFNNDRKYFTYSFLLPSNPPENLEQMEIDHHRRVSQSMIQIQDIMIPKPRSRHKYCGVCRTHYDDYKNHTEGQNHLSYLKKSIYQIMIVEACRHFQRKLKLKDQIQVEDTKITEVINEDNMIKTVSEMSQTSPQKLSSIGQ